MYRFVTMHISGGDEKADDGENVHMVLKRTGKGRDKSGELWDKFEVVVKHSTKDYGDEPWLAKRAATREFKKLQRRRR
jgi:hypothetical protein